MGTLHEFVDRQGKLIRLTEERWAHITREHPDISGVDEIKETIIHPTDMRASDYDPDHVK